MIDSSRGVFDLELEQNKFVEESWEENKNTILARGAARISFVPKLKRRYEVYNAVKLSMFPMLDKELASHLLTCL